MNRQKSTMSVSEMRKMLGIKKTDSYWLVHKNVFKTVTVEGKMRIEIDSFERWYACQTHYKKINGEEPGHLLKQYSYSVRELSELLGVCEDSIDWLIHNHGTNAKEAI